MSTSSWHEVVCLGGDCVGGFVFEDLYYVVRRLGMVMHQLVEPTQQHKAEGSGQ